MYHKKHYVQVLCRKIFNERHYILNICYLIVEVCLSKPIISQDANNNTQCPKFSLFQDSEVIEGNI